jgi:hypothetical protein
MSEKPFCKLCGHRHWLNEGHIWPNEPKPKTMSPKSALSPKTVDAVAKVQPDMAKVDMAKEGIVAKKSMGKKATTAESSTYRYRDPAQRRAYQRDLMRWRYARATQSKSN